MDAIYPMSRENEKNSPVRILYMEDNAGLARLFQKKLQRLGYSVDIAPNGKEGLEKIDRGNYDIVAVDQEMPVMNGLEVIKKLAEDEGKPPAIMVTGAGDEKTAVKAMKLGAEDYMVKDIQCGYIDLFPSVIEGILEKKRMALEKLEAEQALRESEEKYRTLMENANDCIVVIQDEKIIFANSAFEKMIGGSPLRLQKQSVFNFIRYKDREQARRSYDKTIRGEITGSFEVSVITAEGREVVLEVKSNTIRYEGKPAVMGVMRDITGRKKMEDELLKAKKLEAVGILAGGIAHDYNNILAAVLGNISLAKNLARPGEKIHKLLTEAENASIRARELTHKFIVLSKGGEPVRRKLALPLLFREWINKHFAGSAIRFELDFPDGLWDANADNGQIGQAFRNLLVNAEEASPEGGTVSISAENVEIAEENAFSLSKGCYVVVSVIDEGKGIPETLMEKIFDPYFSTKTRGAQKGMGLGLSISHSIVTKHKGYVAVSNKAGKGARFDVYLPAIASRFSVTATPPDHANDLPNRSVLLLEDEEMVRKISCRMIKHLGFEPFTAGDGEDAVALCKKASAEGIPFSTVILDLETSGGAVAAKVLMEKIKEISPDAKIVLSSGIAEDPAMVNYRNAGFSAAIAKPYDIGVLKGVLESEQPF